MPGGVVGESNTFARWQGSIDHFDVWQYGTNLIHAEFDQYGSQDPSLGIPGAQGSREFWAIARSTLGLNELTHSKTFAWGPLKDVSLEAGGNAGVQDDWLDEHTTVGVSGLQFALTLPGVVNVRLMARKEYTRNNFDSCGPAAFGVGLHRLTGVVRRRPVSPVTAISSGPGQFESSFPSRSRSCRRLPADLHEHLASVTRPEGYRLYEWLIV